jgi:microcystin-dependent protein
MGVVNTTYTFSGTDTITSSKLNNIIDETTFTGDAIQGTTLQVVSPGKLAVSAGGITANEIADGQVLLAKIQPTLQSSFVPSGAVMAFAMATAPAGWLAANGDTIPNGSGTVQSKTADFSILHSLLGTTYGSAGKLPDLRGYFVRGSGTNSDGTASDTFGVKQAHMFQDHGHSSTISSVADHTHQIGTVEGASGSQPRAFNDTVGSFTPKFTSPSGGHTHTITVSNPNSGNSGTETRPANIALLYCIKI